MQGEKSPVKFGTLPVFFTAISTILGAIMFLRFGYAVGSVGFMGTLGIILFAHLVTIPTAMAIAEIATNQKVEGGGEYYIISRSFGLNVGATIGVALYLSQAISVAFYTIAFAEAFDPLFLWMNESMDLNLSDKRIVSIPATILLVYLMLKKGASLGTKVLYFVVAILFLSLIMFFVGTTDYNTQESFNWVNSVPNGDSFFIVFAIVFPAFTGMTAGVGLSGDLKNPKKAIPVGTLSATIIGMIIYVFIAYKLAVSASPDSLVSNQLIMADIALYGWLIIPLGLASATISSALGSIMVAPRTLQALAADKVFPGSLLNRWLSKSAAGGSEPLNATIITSIIALVFVAVGDVNVVAEIISMFFMITYGSICLISFLQHFAADPSYRPVFKSRWFISLIGAILCIYLMFSMNTQYAIISVIFMTAIYYGITLTKSSKEGLAKIFQGVIFQISRQLQVFLQKAEKDDDNWRPSVICISTDFYKRPSAFHVLRWISHRYGFGTYIHYIHGYFSKESNLKAREELASLIKVTESTKSNVFVDTMISPSFTSAIAQAIQLPSVSGKELNMILLEYSKNHPENLKEIVENYPLVKAAGYDICILGSSDKDFGFMQNIHIWLTHNDIENSSLMILISYIIMGHSDWKGAEIKIFAVVHDHEATNEEQKLLELIQTGRLPISKNNIRMIKHKPEISTKEIINTESREADLTILGFRGEVLKQNENEMFSGYETIGNVLWVNASHAKVIS